MWYAGIGSRDTPSNLENIISKIARNLELAGFILRSGGADGADKMFSNGVVRAENKEIYLPWKGFNFSDSELYGVCNAAILTVNKYHPSPSFLSDAGVKLMARNAYQVLGKDLNTPSKFVLCWTPGGKEVGGTSQAIRIAKDKGIPVYNLFSDDIRLKFLNTEFVNSLIS